MSLAKFKLNLRVESRLKSREVTSNWSTKSLSNTPSILGGRAGKNI